MKGFLISCRFDFLIGFVLIASTQACQICLPFPTTSAADHLLEADIVVLGRENPDQPFSLHAVEVLKGELGKVPPDLFLDSSTRRILKLFPDRKVICVFRSSGEESGWRRIGTTNATVEPLVREVLGHASEWERNPGKRVEFFVRLLGHEDEQVRVLAHLEVGRAGYDQIKEFAAVLPVQDLRAFLKDYRRVEWHALYILLLAQSGEEGDVQLIAERVRSAERFGSTLQLPAWVTAWIEVDADAAMEFLEQHYLESPERTLEEMRAVLMALSVHGNRGHVHLRDRIVECYRSILGNHAVLAPDIVTDLQAWNRRDLDDSILEILKSPPEGLGLGSQMQLRSYLNRAGSVESGEGKGGGAGVYIFLVVLILIPPVLGISSQIKRRRRRARLS